MNSYMKNLTQFWQDKTVFVTGHTGFKGAWLALWLQMLGAKVIGYALQPSTEPNLFSAIGIADKVTHILGDIREYAALAARVKASRPDIIFHLAAQSLVRYSYTHPIETYETNVLGVVSILEAARQCDSVKAMVNITTDKCYENHEWVWGYREHDALGGHDPYSNSKACAELVTSAYRNSYFSAPRKIATERPLGLATARAGNVIGGGDWAKDRLVPDLIRAFIKNDSIEIRSPHATRPWQHVLEPLSGYLLLAQRLYENPQQYAESWNFGPKEDDIKPVSWLVEKVAQLLGTETKLQLSTQTGLHEANTLRLDCNKARFKLQWQPRWDLNKGLKKTIDWYRAYYQENNTVQAVTQKQIMEFMENQI